MLSVLKQRIITGSILIVLALLFIFYVKQSTFVLIATVVMLLAGWEWSKLAGLTPIWARVAFLILLMATMWLMSVLIPVMSVIYLAVLFWLYALYLICRYPNASNEWRSKTMRVIMGLFVLVPCWLAVNLVHESAHGDWMLLFMFVIIWSADIGAFFVGRKLGKHKLLPLVSPGKTWEGFLGGMVLSFIVAMIGLLVWGIHAIYWPMVIPLVGILNIFAVTGDLFESMLKRNMNLKDSGSILPGHGGILDRLDSLMAAAPVFLLGLLLHWY